MTEKEPVTKTLQIEDREYETLFTAKFEKRRRYTAPDPKKLHCVIPGVVLSLTTQTGKKVQKGERLLVLEAMKMQNDILSPLDGKIKKIHVNLGTMIPKGTLLLEFE
jgi:biotin carboxyl carrier protein